MRIYNIQFEEYFKRREEQEKLRASRARTRTKINKIPVRFPSVNNMYPINRTGSGKRISAEGRVFKNYIYDELDRQDNGSPFFATYYECSYIYYHTNEMLFYKNGEPKKVDVSNYLKATEDAVFDYLMENDSLVTAIHGYKRLIQASLPRLVVIVSEARLDDCICHGVDIFDTEELWKSTL